MTVSIQAYEGKGASGADRHWEGMGESHHSKRTKEREREQLRRILTVKTWGKYEEEIEKDRTAKDNEEPSWLFKTEYLLMKGIQMQPKWHFRTLWSSGVQIT